VLEERLADALDRESRASNMTSKSKRGKKAAATPKSNGAKSVAKSGKSRKRGANDDDDEGVVYDPSASYFAQLIQKPDESPKKT